MDQSAYYCAIVKRLLRNYHSAGRTSDDNLESLLILDDEHGHYAWLTLGWQGYERISAPTMLVRVRQGKIYVEEDWTNLGLVDDLLAEGVPKSDIVLAFHHPAEREFTEFAAA